MGEAWNEYRIQHLCTMALSPYGCYMAEGVHLQAREAAIKNIREAIELYLETLSEEEKKELLNRKVVGIQRVKALA